MPGFWRRHRVAAAALVISGLFTAASLATDAFQVGYDPVAMVFAGVLYLPIGFLVVWVLLFANLRLVAWWRKRRPLQLPPPAAAGAETGGAPPFRWSGRPGRRPWALLGFMAIFVLLGILAVDGQAPGTAAFDVTLGLLVVIVVMVSLAAAYAFRRKTVLIDATGIHVERGFRSDVHVRWSELREIGIVNLPLSEWFAPFSVREPPRMFMLRGQDGAAVGMVQPEGDVPPELRPWLESALRAHAAAHGVPVRDVGYREMVTWRRPRRGAVARSRAP